ncbi:hypothetical protein JMA_39270 (plasmid) [Jeotgalibacillus malaysiensis]|uniref:Uncharacterized protein n=1 Tax=Jeotgalibacillus malaysiensis TaxID=1508404 RepID=A0A0B5ASR1_9BACL|nr:hypothetical protein [Jeotgalibacillus malaysiensis]AJD93245.1 hypothetical protein JMA_39270 [Jeotgalibacillus malaysiensis]
MTLFTFNKGDDGMKVVEEAIEKERAISEEMKEHEIKLQKLVEQAISVRVGALLQAVEHYGHFQVEPCIYSGMDGLCFDGGQIRGEDGCIFRLTDLLLADEKTAHLADTQSGPLLDGSLDDILYDYENWLKVFYLTKEIKFTVTENDVVLRGDEA